MDSNQPTSYLDGLRAYQPTVAINDKFTQVLLISDADLAEVFLEDGPTAEYLLDALNIVRAHLEHVETFLRDGLVFVPTPPHA